MKRIAALVGWFVSLGACNTKHETESSPSPAVPSSSSASESKRVHVTRAEYGDKWPFTVDEGDIECQGRVAMLFIVGQQRYALNGMARSVAQPIRPIWRDVEPGSPMKVYLGPILERGLEACPDLKKLGKPQ